MSTAMRKTVSIHDYPEHLNPFREDDHKTKFWTLGKRLSRSNSINFSGIKDLKNSWALRSFMKKGKKREQPQTRPTAEPQNRPKPVNGEDDSPIVFRRAMQYSSMSRGRNGGPYNSMGGALEQSYGYEHRGSITPLPRSRFQERLRSTSQQEVGSLCDTPRMARSEIGGSRLSIESANPFDESLPPVAPRRRKKRAPLPPADPKIQIICEPAVVTIADSNEANGNIAVVKTADSHEANGNIHEDSDIEDINLNVELKIIEEDDLKNDKEENVTIPTESHVVAETVVISEDTDDKKQESKNDYNITEITDIENNNNVVNASSEEDILKSDVLKSVSFSKVDIIKYRRNSSVNEDDIKLRRGNLEDFALANQRSKSFSNGTDPIYATYNINLNDDTNGKEEKPQKVICKIIDDASRKRSIERSGTDKEKIEIDKVRREFENEINKLNAALEDDFSTGAEMSVSDIKKKYDKEKSSPNPIPKPRRSPELSKAGSPVNGKIHK